MRPPLLLLLLDAGGAGRADRFGRAPPLAVAVVSFALVRLKVTSKRQSQSAGTSVHFASFQLTLGVAEGKVVTDVPQRRDKEISMLVGKLERICLISCNENSWLVKCNKLFENCIIKNLH